MAVLQAKLEKMEEEKEAAKYAAQRAAQIGTGDRSEKIRTYNVLQDRITDHRIKESWHNMPGIMAGNLDPILESLQNFTGEPGGGRTRNNLPAAGRLQAESSYGTLVR
jgi:peptide chain release factor 1